LRKVKCKNRFLDITFSLISSCLYRLTGEKQRAVLALLKNAGLVSDQSSYSTSVAPSQESVGIHSSKERPEAFSRATSFDSTPTLRIAEDLPESSVGFGVPQWQKSLEDARMRVRFVGP
jgi:hypothetical protein